MKKGLKLSSIFQGMENLTVVRAVRNGLIHIIPVLIIGAFSLIFKTFPIPTYQTFISTFLGGFFLKLFDVIYNATFGVLSVYMTYSISRSYMHLKTDSNVVAGGAIIVSLMSFFILAGAYLPDFGIDQMGPKSMFLAIITSIGASYLYRHLYNSFQKRSHYLFLVGGDREFNKMIGTFFSIAIVAFAFAFFNTLIIRIFSVDSCRTLVINAFNGLFAHGESGFFKGFFFVLLSSILWFFGIHGSDTLEGVMQTYFTPGLSANQAAVAAGAVPTTILTKEFFDCFVLMGGCGTTICLLIAILLFSRNHASKRLGLTAAFPMLFNINELMVFGLPIIFNPVMFIPFILVPLVSYSVACLAVATGLVPMITSEVAWTTPVLLGGYTATGSIAGSLLQLTNIVIGVFIYFPFVRILDKQSVEKAKNNFDLFMTYFKTNEQTLSSIRLTELANIYGDYAKDLCNDLRYGLDKYILLAYQPQYDYDGHCLGVEALLRYNHPVLGILYPPLVVKLAEEGGYLLDLEEKVLIKALQERPQLLNRFGDNIKLSVNVTGTTVFTEQYIQFCKRLNDSDPFAGKNICIEITEQTAIYFNEKTLAALHTLHEMGLLLAIDDFSMGQTSIHYLRDNMFDIIKLDGSLVDGLTTHKNTYDIISSIVQLAKSLNMAVIAEFVDTKEKREILHQIDCNCYQGFLYSPAVFLENQ